MKTKLLFATLMALLVNVTALRAQNVEEIQYRIEKMHCNGCAGRVKKALNAQDGVQKADIDLGKRVVIISYDKSKTTPQSMEQALADAKYPASPYSENEVITRSFMYKTVQMHCNNCANRIKKGLGAVPGVLAVDTDLENQTVKITYDANKVSRNSFKEAFGKSGYTVTAFYSNEAFAYAQYTLDKAIGEKDLEELAGIKGIADANSDGKKCYLALTYNTKVIDKARIEQFLKEKNYTWAE